MCVCVLSGKPGSKTSPDKTVVVQWDSGLRTNYRVGYQGKYDLKIVDNASIGIRHPNVVCDNCQIRGIQGVRWKCTKCFDFDLCHACYMADKHDLTHPFMRYESYNSQGLLSQHMPFKRLSFQKPKILFLLHAE
jgi:E3 ubiquitin-protein ligase mind-bomb